MSIYLLFIPVILSTFIAVISPKMPFFIVGHLVSAAAYIYLQGFSFIALGQAAVGFVMFIAIAGLLGMKMSIGWYQIILSTSLLPLTIHPWVIIGWVIFFPIMFFIVSVVKSLFIHKRLSKEVRVNLSAISLIAIVSTAVTTALITA